MVQLFVMTLSLVNISRIVMKEREKEIAATEAVYATPGPLWQKYHRETREKAKFPRGYKEVTLLNT